MKRRISDLIDHMPCVDVEMEYSAPLSRERIKELTMDKIKEKAPKRRIGLKILLVAAVIAVMTMTVFAAENIMSYDNWFMDFFSGKEVVADISENQLALLDISLARLDQSVTSGGYTVTLETAITDGYTAYLTFRVEAPEDVTLDAVYYLFREVPMELYGEDLEGGDVYSCSAGWQMLDDSDPSDNSVLLLLNMSTDAPDGRTSSMTDGEEKTITLHTLLEDRGPEYEREVLAEGEWTFTFHFADSSALTEEIEMLSSPVRCTGRRMSGQHFFDVGVRVTSFRLRALTATMFFEEPLTGYWEGILLDPIYVVMEDGSRVRANFRSGATREGQYECGFEFDVPISFADVDYIEFGGGDRAYMPDTETE